MLIRGRVRMALEVVKLIELVSLSLEPNARELIGQIGFVAVPAELPGHDDVHDPGPGLER